jgi:hypothetical protein
MAVGRALLGSELVQPVINKLVSSGALDPNVERLIYGQSLGSTLARAAEPMGRLMGLLPEERPNYNLPADYYVGPQGQVLSSEGERMVTGQGVSGFQPENQYGSRGFEEPRYEPPMPWNYSMNDAGNIPSQISMGASAQEFPSWSLPRVGMPDLAQGLPSAVPVESVNEELERLAARYAEQPATAEEETDEASGGVWWPQAPQVDPRFLAQQNAQQR